MLFRSDVCLIGQPSTVNALMLLVQEAGLTLWSPISQATTLQPMAGK